MCGDFGGRGGAGVGWNRSDLGLCFRGGMSGGSGSVFGSNGSSFGSLITSFEDGHMILPVLRENLSQRLSIEYEVFLLQ